MASNQGLNGAVIKSVIDYLVNVEALLASQLFSCRENSDDFSLFSRGNFFRGYVFGYFEAALQWKGINLADDEAMLLQCLAITHARLLGCDHSVATSYLVDSLNLQDDQEFSDARVLGGTECYAHLDGKIKMPVGLVENFMATQGGRSSGLVSIIGKGDSHRAFSEEDVVLLQSLSDLLARTSGYESFIDFIDIYDGAQSCAIGVRTKKGKLMLGSVVATRGPKGFDCSVKNFQGERLAGLPEYYSSVEDALVAHKEYFLVMVNALRDQRKPWWKRILS